MQMLAGAKLGDQDVRGCESSARGRCSVPIPEERHETLTRWRAPAKRWLALTAGAIIMMLASSAAAADMPTKGPQIRSAVPSVYDWSGFYVGGHLGYAWGNSNWTASRLGGESFASGSLDLFQPFDSFGESGSFFDGVQAGYDYMLPNRFVIGGEADASFPSFPNLAGISVGGTSTLSSPIGAESYSENVRAFGTLRGRIGYADNNWLFYATGGFAWTYDQLTLTQLASGATESPFLWRLGWAAGGGIEVPVAPHWTASIEYLFTDYGNSSVQFASAGQRFTSDFSLQELRAGLNYRFDSDAPENAAAAAPAAPDLDNLNFHGQTTFVWQGYPPIRSPHQGLNSLPGNGEGRETFDATLLVGRRLWQGAELWIDGEIDQGFGLANTHGAAGFTSEEALKIGSDYPYARVQRYFVRQTVDLGGKSEKVEADLNQFAGSQTANRLVLTVGKFAIVDIFDTNKYANNPKSDFLNWSLVNAGTFDDAGDAWAYTYGAAAEWYRGDWTLRGGIFDLSATPAGGISPASVGLDPTFEQFQLVGEIEKRYQLWGQPGALKITGFLSRGRAGHFADAIALSQLTGQPADINAVRTYDSRPGVSLNLQQQIADDLGVFARAGWADGSIEPWDFTDIDGTVSAGISIVGKKWGRPDDTVGIAGVVNAISGVHQAFLNAGGLGILVGDGQLPDPGLEKIIEAYYSYAVSSSTKLSVDYQFIDNPGYNADRGPVNVFSGRVHWQF